MRVNEWPFEREWWTLKCPPKGVDVEYVGEFSLSSSVQILAGGTGHISNQCLWYFIWNASWSVESCWYYMPIVTAAIPVVVQRTGAGAPALRAKATEACNQAFWYGLVQSHPVKTKHRWRPVIHVHQWVTQTQTGCSWPSALEFVKNH